MPAPSTATNTPRSEASSAESKLDPNAAVMEALLAKISSLEAMVIEQRHLQLAQAKAPQPLVVTPPPCSKFGSPSPSSPLPTPPNDGHPEPPQRESDDEEEVAPAQEAQADDIIVMPGTGTKATSPNKGYQTFLLHAPVCVCLWGVSPCT